MTRRILIEFALFSIPFLIFFMYRAASTNMSVKDRWPLLWLVIAGGVLAGGGLFIKAMLYPSDKGLCFQAARYENRVFIPAKKVPCDQVVHPTDRDLIPGTDADGTERVHSGSTARKLPTVMEPTKGVSEETDEDGN
ncbi:hypothetical protein [Hirschia baltica]|uniref:Uncharacterized protein n=1 Tax=Hirschia baltica (strain ATCC 49814 / DSM 5838 / IFAM 1418) TaxID=582402 RepID=C6XPE5_HIRBI|nr:hypothetical protein [Hirschia baltica]ACT58431.1 hypothetical protein Hbal_0737 [Hirschia baltica ATCC 49814]